MSIVQSVVAVTEERPLLRDDAPPPVQASWVQEWVDREGGWAAKISQVADHNPAQIKRIEGACTFTEVASAWKSRMAAALDVGYTFPNYAVRA